MVTYNSNPPQNQNFKYTNVLLSLRKINYFKLRCCKFVLRYLDSLPHNFDRKLL